MSAAETDRIKKRLTRDNRFKRLRSAFKDLPQYRIPFDEYRRELKMLHTNRMMRGLTVADPNFINKLSEAVIIDTSNRGRLTEMLVTCTQASKSLESATIKLRDYLLMEYSSELKYWKTVGERKAYVESVLRPFLTYLDDVKGFAEEVDLYIKDIDKAGYVVKNLVDAYALIYKPERNVRL